MSIYETVVEVEGGRGGHAESHDGNLAIDLAPPTELGGDGHGTNPEQLFAAGFAACWLSALGVVARRHRLALDAPRARSTVTLHREDTGFTLSVHFVVEVAPDRVAQVRELVPEVSATCPYSRATAGNIEVAIDVQARA